MLLAKEQSNNSPPVTASHSACTYLFVMMVIGAHVCLHLSGILVLFAARLHATDMMSVYAGQHVYCAMHMHAEQ